MSQLLEQLTGRSRVCAVAITSGSPIALEIAGDLGFSAVVIDARHGPTSPYSHELGALVRAARASAVPVVVRLPESTPGTINRALNDGVHGIIVPTVEDAQGARNIVDWSRYPPAGKRGAAPVVRAAGYGVRDWDEYREESNERRAVLCSLEDTQALKNAESIVDVPGIDGVVLDAATLRMVIGASSVTPDALARAATVARHAADTGKISGVIVQDTDDAVAWAEVGSNLVIIESDVAVALGAMTAARAAMVRRATDE